MTMKKLAMFGMLSSMVLVLFMIIPSYSQLDTATVIIYPTDGGTTNPGPGSHTYPGGVFVTLTATAMPGWQFSYWEFLGPKTGDVLHGGEDGLVVFTSPTVSFDCASGYAVEWQAVFVPM